MSDFLNSFSKFLYHLDTFTYFSLSPDGSELADIAKQTSNSDSSLQNTLGIHIHIVIPIGATLFLFSKTTIAVLNEKNCLIIFAWNLVARMMDTVRMVWSPSIRFWPFARLTTPINWYFSEKTKYMTITGPNGLIVGNFFCRRNKHFYHCYDWRMLWACYRRGKKLRLRVWAPSIICPTV